MTFGSWLFHGFDKSAASASVKDRQRHPHPSFSLEELPADQSRSSQAILTTRASLPTRKSAVPIWLEIGSEVEILFAYYRLFT